VTLQSLEHEACWAGRHRLLGLAAHQLASLAFQPDVTNKDKPSQVVTNHGHELGSYVPHPGFKEPKCTAKVRKKKKEEKEKKKIQSKSVLVCPSALAFLFC
jgi:hypothetical protein